MMEFTCYFARGEEHEDDDIDLIVRFDCENAKVGLFKYAAIVFDLEKLLNRQVDLVAEGALLPFAERTANKDKKLIYERSPLHVILYNSTCTIRGNPYFYRGVIQYSSL